MSMSLKGAWVWWWNAWKVARAAGLVASGADGGQNTSVFAMDIAPAIYRYDIGYIGRSTLSFCQRKANRLFEQGLTYSFKRKLSARFLSFSSQVSPAFSQKSYFFSRQWAGFNSSVCWCLIGGVDSVQGPRYWAWSQSTNENASFTSHSRDDRVFIPLGTRPPGGELFTRVMDREAGCGAAIGCPYVYRYRHRHSLCG